MNYFDIIGNYHKQLPIVAGSAEQAGRRGPAGDSGHLDQAAAERGAELCTALWTDLWIRGGQSARVVDNGGRPVDG
jgi:hypothetical protein